MNHGKTSRKIYWFKKILNVIFHKISYIGVVLLNNKGDRMQFKIFYYTNDKETFHTGV